jgi:CHASE1-domain containing sensor protein
MFYIKQPKLAKRENFFSHILPSLIILIAFAGLSTLSWLNAQQNVKVEQEKIAQQRNQATSNDITQRLAVYENILLGSAGLFSASATVERAEWKQYVNSIDVQSRYPGFQGIGYAEIVRPENKTQHERSIKAEGFPSYAIFPEGERAVYTSIKFIEPFNDRNQNALGYDMYSDKTRAKAMDAAALEGRAAISEVVTLLQEQNEAEKQPGFLMYVPVYKQGSMPTTKDQRKQNIIGFVYAPFRAYDLINSAISEDDANYGFIISDKSNGQEIFTTQNYSSLLSKKSYKQIGNEITIAGNTWKLEGITGPDIVNRNIRERPGSALWGGIIFSSVIAGLIYVLLGNRSRSLAEKEAAGIQEAKDELLALASHQLRTPATGVKQYVGMLREGFAGKLTKQQTELVEKAYASNERQLSTINEILFIAKADAGQLKMSLKKINLSQLINEIIEEQKNVIKVRRQKLHSKVPRKAIYIDADSQYLRMAIENLISNATKYTYAGGSIKYSAQRRYDQCLPNCR